LDSPEELLCLFSSRISESEDGGVVQVPHREIESGSVEPGESYRVALIRTKSTESEETAAGRSSGQPQPPVERGEIRYVEVEDLGKQGDGIARVERGYVIIVPETDVGDRVKIEITEVETNFAVGDIVETTSSDRPDGD
jgi:Predicted RNA-binding protein, contains TRAM domain